MADPKVLIAATALNKMFRSSHFSICTLREVAEMLGIHPEREAYKMLHPLHCVNWADMPRELRDQVPRLVEQALAGGFQAFEVKLPASQALQVIDAAPATRRPLIKRLFGGPHA